MLFLSEFAIPVAVVLFLYINKKAPTFQSELLKKMAATYSPASCSTIGANGLNFSVRYGKRWNPIAVAT